MPERRGRPVLVAGGAGFIGSHLCEALLADGDEVLCLDNLQTGSARNLAAFEREPRFHFVESDVIAPLPTSLRTGKVKPAQVWNLACPASPPLYQADPVHTMLTSVVGTHALLALAERVGARFVMASTSEVYGDPTVHPQVETYWGNVNPTGPRACYDEGKRAAETLCFDFERAGRVDVRVSRIFNTYGPRMRRDDGRVISNVVCQAISGEDITVYGDGRQTRSFCYVTDLVDGLLRLGSLREAARLGPVNLGNPDELTIAEVVERVVELTGSRSAVVRRPLPEDDPQRRRPDIAKAKARLGWSPGIGLDEGLRATVEHFRGELARSGKPNGAATRDGRRASARLAAEPDDRVP